ncbi:hypothetical protein ND748_19530 [Frankia sp. AiPs1]|uniref:hypothetical protein n=1 Tax=Frankia sp. AiPs1 TaxID=573493 RepID=UPI002044BD39|nr:hypothetical protein [Frankia sp. AiPs1]MCM3923851.1 hypothetical protein [Frankia sp. AiPs1]
MDLDPLSVPALAALMSAVLAGTTSEAGGAVWRALVGLVRRSFGAGPLQERIVRDELDSADVDFLAQALADRADSDPAFAAALRRWSAQATAVAGGNDSVTNQIGGDAVIEGDVIQARDISGPITFGHRG